MGSRLSFACSCGYQGGSSLGGARLNFQVYCGAPAICRACADVKTVNAKEPLACPTCRGPVELLADLRGEEGFGMGMSWRLDGPTILVVQPGPHRCPKCNRTELRIADSGMRFD